MDGRRTESIKVAAVQLQPVIGDVTANLEACEKLANEAAEKGVKWILLPEFFSSGMGFDERIANTVLPPDGAAMNLMTNLAKRHNAVVGGSFLCRDKDGLVHNAFFLVSPEGILGRHDKDLPTMWENCFYVEGADDGIIKAGDMAVGSALCWEFMRTQTVRRIREKVDLVAGGSCWWSVPSWSPKSLTNKWEIANSQTAMESVRSFSTFVGAPVIHASHCGNIECAMPWMPLKYRGYFEAGAMIVNAEGEVLAIRDRLEGPGIVVGEVVPGKVTPKQEVPDSFWLHKRGPLPAFAWSYQRIHGKRWYSKHMVTSGKTASEGNQ
ncbi:carbon-nitrogen hydrolase family protein [Bacillus sp. FJAT-29814]|uniref:carbon-nitrogen hydrolase family protein n=1 Tax=Bacillus sp. FJAT-29814 TaxID=1729688 RepID=UPI000B2B4EFF|nr:carbon-nitrogen hydrolase family protein [Bacillus sp. FJAT-29814]